MKRDEIAPERDVIGQKRMRYPRKAFIKSSEPCDNSIDHICEFECSMDHCCQYIAESLMNGTMKLDGYTIYPVGSNCKYAHCPFCGLSWGCSPEPGHLD
jgi:hypothetical protein